MIEGKIIFAFSFRASESPCHPHHYQRKLRHRENAFGLGFLFYIRSDEMFFEFV